MRPGVVAALLALACGRTAAPAPGADEVPPPIGDQAVFAGIRLVVDLFEYDQVRFEHGPPPAAGPIELIRNVSVRVNGGTTEARVPDLRILCDGEPLMEYGSAGYPQHWSYSKAWRPQERGRPFLLEIQRGGASFFARWDAVTATIERPPADARVGATEVVLSWSGGAGVPEVTVLAQSFGGAQIQSCFVGWQPGRVTEREAQLLPQRRPAGRSPCVVDAELHWRSAEPAQKTPFRAFEIERALIRIWRFSAVE